MPGPRDVEPASVWTAANGMGRRGSQVLAGGRVESLWNGSVADDGVSRGLAADAIPAQPPRTIAIDTIHRFKGLERDVVVLVELRPDDERLGILLYVGASRAKHHLVVIATPELARPLGKMKA